MFLTESPLPDNLYNDSLTTTMSNLQDFSISKDYPTLEMQFAIVLGLLGLLANSTSLIAISQIGTGLSTNLRLIVSLCSSDMMVSMSILMRLLYKHQRQDRVADTCIELLLRAARTSSNIVSLLNLVGLALDHYCAIIRPLEYPRLMRRKHANLMIVSFWILSFLCGFSDFIIPSKYLSYCNATFVMHYCDRVACSVYNEEYIMFAATFVSTLLMTTMYTRIYFKIQKYQRFPICQIHKTKRNVRGLFTTFAIVSTFMISWLPYCLFDAIMIIASKINPQHTIRYFAISIRWEYRFYNLLLCNTIADPIIYATRMQDVRNGYKNIFYCRNRGRRLSRAYSLTSSSRSKSSKLKSATTVSSPEAL